MLTVHGLLHIPDSIELAGPQWCYWAYPMERYCGALQPGIRSRRFPYASLDRWVLETAQLAQVGVLYNITSELKLRPPPNPNPQGSCRVPGYNAALLIGPTAVLHEIPAKVLGALATRFNLGNQKTILTKQILKEATCIERSKIRRVDSEAGDTMAAADSPSTALANQQDLRDKTFVRYEVYVDKHIRQRNRDPVLEPRTFYGQLQKIYLIKLQNTEVIQIRKPKLTVPIDHCILLVAIRNCKVTGTDERLDLHFYSQVKQVVDVVDATALQCVLGRVPDGTTRANGTYRDYGIVDRRGTLARALYLDDLDDE
ncbi:hypothetical protein C8R45DRAFT_1160700 [Mycena sanguinolenta]|nr:hypothetical protein C8R45DRAFT_1160700 [Mycena sanguinolenta]